MLPLRWATSEGVEELTGYLAELAGWMERDGGRRQPDRCQLASAQHGAALDEINESFHQIVREGTQRLHRTWRTVFVTGTFGGLEIGVGVMAYLAVQHETGNHLLAGLALGVGFMALLLAKSEDQPAGAGLPASSSVVGAFDPGDDGNAELLSAVVSGLI